MQQHTIRQGHTPLFEHPLDGVDVALLNTFT
jgi:hypothetical protein